MKENNGNNKDNFEDSGDEIFDTLKDFYKPGKSSDLWNFIDSRLKNDEDFTELKEQKKSIEKDIDKREKRLAKVYHLSNFQEQKARREDEAKLAIFHEEILSEPDDEIFTIEDRYWQGLSDFIDGESSPTKQAQVTEHLIDCRLCRERFTELSKLNKVVRDNVAPEDMMVEADPEEFWAQVSEAIDQEPKPRSRIPYKKMAIAASIVGLVALAGVASFKYKEEYNYVLLPEDGKVAWNKLNLNSEQARKIAAIDSKWQKLKEEQEEYINKRKVILDKELSKTNPNLTLIDQHQREVLDREIFLKREEANVFLEKRFILSEKQTFELLKQL